MINDRLKLRFVSFTLMLSLAAALAMSAAAEEAAPQPSSDAKATNSGTHSPDSSPTGKNSPPPSGEANTEDIDTRITVQPHGPPAGKPGKVGGATNPIVPLKLVNPHRRTFLPVARRQSFRAKRVGLPRPSASERPTKFRPAFRIPRPWAEGDWWRRGRRRRAREAWKPFRSPTSFSAERYFPNSRWFEDAHSRRHRRCKLKPSRRRIGHFRHRRPHAHGDRNQRFIDSRDSLEFESFSNSLVSHSLHRIIVGRTPPAFARGLRKCAVHLADPLAFSLGE